MNIQIAFKSSPYAAINTLIALFALKYAVLDGLLIPDTTILILLLSIYFVGNLLGIYLLSVRMPILFIVMSLIGALFVMFVSTHLVVQELNLYVQIMTTICVQGVILAYGSYVASFNL